MGSICDPAKLVKNLRLDRLLAKKEFATIILLVEQQKNFVLPEGKDYRVVSPTTIFSGLQNLAFYKISFMSMLSEDVEFHNMENKEKTYWCVLPLRKS